MNVREMHIEVDFSMQKVNSNRTRKFKPEEIDQALNKVQNRFIASKLKPRKDGSGGFEIDELGIDAVRTILVTNRELNAYIESNNRYVSYLPSDYSYLISDASIVTDLCGRAALPQPITSTLNILTLRQEVSQKASSMYYATLSITMDKYTVAIPGSLPYINEYTGYLNKKDIIFLVPYILQQFRRAGKEVYWERFDSMYIPSTYILVGASTFAGVMSIDGNILGQFNTSAKTLLQHTDSGALTDNRLSSSAAISSLNSSAFYKTSAKTPISELAGTNLYVYRDNSFIVSSTRVSYIRKPQTISLLLGTDCELAEGYHQTICDLTVEYLKGRLENLQGEQITESDNERRVIL